MKRTALAVFLGAALAYCGFAQTSRATLQGLVQDPAGAVVPNTSVTVTNIQTGVISRGQSNSEGRYVVPYLLPGDYSLAVEKVGFRRFLQEGIRLAVEQTHSVDVVLTLGDVSTTVQVEGAPPPLATTTSTVSTTVENKFISDLPLIGRNMLGLATLLPGVLPPQGNAGSSGNYGPTIGGGRTGSGDIRVDGTTMMLSDANNGIMIMGGSLPDVDAVQEFTVVVNALAAEYGRSGSGALLFASKAGTNKLHGTLFDFFRDNHLNANNFFSNRAGTRLTSFTSNQFGFSLGGPVYLPKVYDGRNRTFFFADYQGSRSRSPSNFSGTVPLAAWKAGDFSDLRTSSGARMTIFDPATISSQPDASGNYLRQPMPGNVIPASRFDPVAKAMIAYYPEPNTTPTNQYTQQNNYYKAQVAPGSSNNFTARIDHSFTDNWHAFWRLTKSNSLTNPPNVWGNPATPLGRAVGDNPKHSVTWNNTYTVNASTFVELTYGLSRFSATSNPPSAGFDLTTLGFPAYMQQQAQKDIYTRFPRVDVASLTSLGQQQAAGIRFTPTAHNATGSMTKVLSRHTIKAGVEYRKFFLNFWQESNPGGAFSYGQNWTQRNPVRAVTTEGFGLASMLLGLGSGSQQNQIAQALASSYWGTFIQDDFHVSRRLTINIGLRYELDVPRTERFNRMSWWDADATSPIAGQVPGYNNLRGVMNFVTPDHRRQTPTDSNNWSPRFGWAFTVDPKTVVRGGYAFMYAPSITQATYGGGGFQGYRCGTSMITSLDGRVPLNYLRNPFPDGFCAADGPKAGPYSGPNTSLGQSIGESWFIDYVNPNVQQWNFNLQREVPGNMVAEIGYIGNKGNHLMDGGRSSYNQLPDTYFSLGNALNDSVPNPFYGIILDPTSTLSRPTITRRQSLAPYPQYTAVNTAARPIGNSIYHAMIVRLQRRFSNGVGFLVSYTAGKEITDSGWGNTITSLNGSTARQNIYNRKDNRTLSADDVSSRLVVSFNAELPFGRGRWLLNRAPLLLDLVLGGWQFNGIITAQAGLPVAIFSSANQAGLGNAAQKPNNNGKSADLSAQNRTINEKILRWFDESVFSVAPTFTWGNASAVLPDVRNPGIANYDLSLFKSFRVLPENRLSAQLRLEASNALNKTQLGRPSATIGSANPATISGTGVGPRSVQLALKLVF